MKKIILLLLAFIIMNVSNTSAVAPVGEIMLRLLPQEVIYGQKYKLSDLFEVHWQHSGKITKLDSNETNIRIKRNQPGILYEWLEVGTKTLPSSVKETITNGVARKENKVLFFETGVFTVSAFYAGGRKDIQIQVLLPAEFRQDTGRYFVKDFDDYNITCWYKVQPYPETIFADAAISERGDRDATQPVEFIEKIPVKEEMRKYFYEGGLFEKLEVVTGLHKMIWKRRQELTKKLQRGYISGYNLEKSIFEGVRKKLQEKDEKKSLFSIVR